MWEKEEGKERNRKSVSRVAGVKNPFQGLFSFRPGRIARPEKQTYWTSGKNLATTNVVGRSDLAGGSNKDGD